MQPVVITSKPAADHVEMIKTQHAAILDGIANQATKVAAYNQQRASELAAKNTEKMAFEKEKSIADTQAKKDANDMALKQEELSIKRSALSAV